MIKAFWFINRKERESVIITVYMIIIVAWVSFKFSIFSIFIELCNHYYNLILEHFHWAEKKHNAHLYSLPTCIVSPRQTPFSFCLHTFAFSRHFIWIWIMHYVIFCVLLLNIISLLFTHIEACISTIIFNCSVIFHCMHTPYLFIHSPVNGHVGSFYFLAIMIRLLWIFPYRFLYACVFPFPFLALG